MEVAPAFADVGDETMHGLLLGSSADREGRTFISDILRYPDSAWVVDVQVPDLPSMYGPASGMSLPVVTFVTYPSAEPRTGKRYAFPYHDAAYGIFEDMLGPGEIPRFADPEARYPLIVLAHGAPAHGIFDVGHAHRLASHGYIVAVPTYGDGRTAFEDDERNAHVAFLRPLLTKGVIDSLVESETFGPHIDADNIGITGHSFGGFTALAMAGAPIQGNPRSVTDERIKAVVPTAPSVGGHLGFAFGPGNSGLEEVTAATLWFFGTKDEVTRSSSILPAARKVSGPVYMIELVDQPHVFEGGSWQDRDNWETLFYAAYLTNDPGAMALLETGGSMKGGNDDVQLFDYQRPTRRSGSTH